MSTATIRKVDSSDKQALKKSDGNHSETDSIARPTAKFDVQGVNGDVHLRDAVATAREQNSEYHLNARRVAIQLGASERFVGDDFTRRSSPRGDATSSTAQFAELETDYGAGQCLI